MIFHSPSLHTVPKAFIRSAKVICENHINSPSTCAESSLALQEMTLLHMLRDTIEEYTGEDLTGDGERGYPLWL